MARSQQAGRRMAAMDAFFAATAAAHDLVLATRNLKDFDGLGVAVHDPWKPSG